MNGTCLRERYLRRGTCLQEDRYPFSGWIVPIYGRDLEKKYPATGAGQSRGSLALRRPASWGGRALKQALNGRYSLPDAATQKGDNDGGREVPVGDRYPATGCRVPIYGIRFGEKVPGYGS